MAETGRTLFSWNPAVQPKCACPHCGWQTFWEYTTGAIQCERCKRFLDALVEPWEPAP